MAVSSGKWAPALLVVALMAFSPCAAEENNPTDQAETASTSSVSSNNKVMDQKFAAIRRQRNEANLRIEELKSELQNARNELAQSESDLRKIRDDLQNMRGTAQLRADIDRLKEDKTETDAELTRATAALEAARKKESPDKDQIALIERRLESAGGRLSSINQIIRNMQAQATVDEERALDLRRRETAAQSRVNVLKIQVERVSKDLKDKTQELSRIDDKILDELTPLSERNAFKKIIALAFTGLVGIVILGFFAVAWRDERVRQSVFTSESGIQFLTLFSLVIAIILFGITEILESKELSALLGGLSGYILGRVAAKS